MASTPDWQQLLLHLIAHDKQRMAHDRHMLQVQHVSDLAKIGIYKSVEELFPGQWAATNMELALTGQPSSTDALGLLPLLPPPTTTTTKHVFQAALPPPPEDNNAPVVVAHNNSAGSPIAPTTASPKGSKPKRARRHDNDPTYAPPQPAPKRSKHDAAVYNNVIVADPEAREACEEFKAMLAGFNDTNDPVMQAKMLICEAASTDKKAFATLLNLTSYPEAPAAPATPVVMGSVVPVPVPVTAPEVPAPAAPATPVEIGSVVPVHVPVPVPVTTPVVEPVPAPVVPEVEVEVELGQREVLPPPPPASLPANDGPPVDEEKMEKELLDLLFLK